MLNIIYGTDTIELDGTIKNKIGTEDDKVWILVPEQFSLSTEKSVIRDFGISAQSRIKVVTFSRLCNLILSKLGPLRLKYIDGAGRQIIAAKTVRELKKKVRYMASAINKRGFASDIAALASEFKRYGVTTEMIEEAANKADNDELSLKLEDISLIFDTFNRFMNEKYSDAEDNLSLICPKIQECDFLSGNIYVLHFRSFTPVEYIALGELMKIADVSVSLICDDIEYPSPIFSPVAETCRKLFELAENNSIGVGEVEKVNEADSESELVYLRREYFSKRPKLYKDRPKNIHICKFNNAYREAEAAADLIVKLCRTENKKFSDFLILARDTSAYNRVIPSIFESRGIDVFLDTRRSILTKPLVAMICAVLEIAAHGYSYDRVMSIARSGLLNITDYETDIFENYLLAVSPSFADWDKKEWDYMPKGYNAKKINETRNKICAVPKYLMSEISGHKTAAQISGTVLKALEKFKIPARTNSICGKFEENKMLYLADEYRQVWNSVVSVLAQISALMDGENITYRDFYDLFKSACGGITVGLAPQTQGGVVFASIDRFRNENTPVVIVLGMNDGVFPAPHTSEGLISDAERIRLRDLGVCLAPVLEAKLSEEQLLVYSTLTAATEKLYLFYAAEDNDGAELAPSSIIKRIKERIFDKAETETPGKGDPLDGTEGKYAAFEILCAQITEAQGGELSPLGKVLYDYFINDEVYGQELTDIVKKISSPVPERLNKESVRAIYGDKIMLSATKLERYNSCAFAYFMQYGLLAAEREKAGIKPQNMGTVQHDALYRYFSKLGGDDYFSITQKECFDSIYDIVKDVAYNEEDALCQSSSYYKYIVSRMQGITARTAWETVKFYRSSMFRPLGNEITIKTGGDIPELSIKNTDGEEFAVLRGQIDRADSAVINGKNYISIVDYKSSETELDKELAAAGVKFQPLLYSDIICKRMKASPAAMLYMQMTDPIINAEDIRTDSEDEREKLINKSVKFGGWLNSDSLVVAGYSKGGENGEVYFPKGADSLVEAEELERRIEEANEKIVKSALDIYNGNIKAEPYVKKFKFDACRYCPYGVSCGHNQ